MKQRRLLWRVFTSYFILICSSVFLAGVSSWMIIRDYNRRSEGRAMETVALAARSDFSSLISSGNRAGLQRATQRLSSDTHLRVTVIAPDGVVLAESDLEADIMENHGNRPEIIQALGGHNYSQPRESRTIYKKLWYTAVPVYDEDRIVGVLRLSSPISVIDSHLSQARHVSLLAAVFTLLIMVPLSFLLARRFSRPVEAMRRGAEAFGRGEFQRRVPVPDIPEFAELAQALNTMSEQLSMRLSEIIRQRNERSAILDSMQEGVLAVDRQERVLSLNGAAEIMLGVSQKRDTGRLIQEAVRNADLQRYIARELSGAGVPREGGTLIQISDEVVISVRSVPLRGADGEDMGILVILNDVTRIRRLENLRREFVANVSHELRTPVTSIKGFAETLLDGDLSDAGETRKFMEIVLRHADRLSEIIEDLLSISRLEEIQQIERSDCLMTDLIEDASEVCSMAFQERGIRLHVDCPAGLTVKAGERLMEQAISNLLDNAAKYSQPGKEVWVKAGTEDGKAYVRVMDHGCGIEETHWPRLFDRFYRVDKGRSRELGGTGLGLSIVKHIAQLHGGTVHVESTPGEGSTFEISWPED